MFFPARLRPSRPNLPHRQILKLEPLEDRILLAGDLLLTALGSSGSDLMEYTQQGAQVSSVTIPMPTGATGYQDVEGLSVDPSGNAQVLDGAASGYLATYAPGQQTPWTYQTASDWAFGNNVTYGEAAAYKNFVFVSNMYDQNGPPNGVIRFDTSGGSPVAFSPGTTSKQVTLGLDGQLYELVGSGDPAGDIEVFNPDTLAKVRSIQLGSSAASDIRSIAVDASGNIYAAGWNGVVAKFDPNGNATGANILLKSQLGFGEGLMNIALDNDGQIAVGGEQGDVFLTDESLSSLQSFKINYSFVFVTFDHYIGGSPQTVTPSFSSLAGPTITSGQPTVTLGGKITAGSTYPPGSVNITLAGVTKSAAISSADGSFSAIFDTSSLAASGSPYTITYSYPAQGNYNAITDTLKSLTVLLAPTVTTDPTNVTVRAGLSATFTAAADGNPAPTVRWEVSSDKGTTWTDVSGATSTQLTLSNVSSSLEGNEYRAVFTNSLGSTATKAATLTVQTMPVVTTNPANVTVTAGQTATFTAAADGNPTPTVQWQVSSDSGKTWTDISGATSTSLMLTNVLSSLNGSEYRAVFTNSVDSGTTAAATLAVQTVPAVTSGSSTAFMVGQDGGFTVTATGSPAPTLALLGVLPGGVTFTDNGNGRATLTGTPAAGTQGIFHFIITAHNGAGSDVEQNFTLTVIAPPAPAPSSPPPSPSAPTSSHQPPALNVPPLLALFDSMLAGIETINAHDTETITDSLFGTPLLVSTYDGSGNFLSASLFGINLPNWIWFE